MIALACVDSFKDEEKGGQSGEMFDEERDTVRSGFGDRLAWIASANGESRQRQREHIFHDFCRR
jgi:hypothetical protein